MAMHRISSRPILIVILAALVFLVSCKIDWTDAFSSNNNNNASDNTANVTDTNVNGLDVVQSSSGFKDTYNNLRNSISQQTDRTQFIDLASLANGNRTNNGNGNNGNNTGNGSNTITGNTGTGTTGNPITTITNTVTGSGAGASGNSMTGNTVTGNGTSSDNNSVRPTRLILFDNPSRTTPVLHADLRAGLELPPAMLVYQDKNGNVGIAYNDTGYLANRYHIGDASDALGAIADNEKTLAQDAAGGNGLDREGAGTGTTVGQGIVDTRSDNDFQTTLDNLISAINNDSGLQLEAQIDHQAAASSAGLSLNPSTLLLFDATDDDSALLRTNQTAGVDLPQRILVTAAADGTVHLYYINPGYTANRHNIDGRGDNVDNLLNTLSDLVDMATGQ